MAAGLLETFADQAVIANENARLFEELQESNRELTQALDRQTALGEVLRVIAASPTDPKDVLQPIVDTAARLCQVDNVGIDRVVGDEVERVANFNRGPRTPEIGTRRPLVPSSWAGRAILERRTVHQGDFDAIVDAEYPVRAPIYRQAIDERGGQTGLIRTLLVIPLLREHDAIGALIVTRYEVRPFTEAEIALLETFADQAVIAIENARLFQELQERTAQLSRSVEEQGTLAEVSQAISSSLDLQQVLTTIVSHATRLAAADGGTIYELDEASGEFVHRASYGVSDEVMAAFELGGPSLHDESSIGRAARSRVAVQSPDLMVSRFVGSTAVLDALIQAGFRANQNRLVVECPEDVGDVQADQTKVRQTLFNLLSNAAKLTHHGTISLTVARESDEWLTFAVADTGIGMTSGWRLRGRPGRP